MKETNVPLSSDSILLNFPQENTVQVFNEADEDNALFTGPYKEILFGDNPSATGFVKTNIARIDVVKGGKTLEQRQFLNLDTRVIHIKQYLSPWNAAVEGFPTLNIIQTPDGLSISPSSVIMSSVASTDTDAAGGVISVPITSVPVSIPTDYTPPPDAFLGKVMKLLCR